MSDSVIISGLCPRLDDVFGNIHKANGCQKSISSEMSIEYVENEPHFRNHNKTVTAKLQMARSSLLLGTFLIGELLCQFHTEVIKFINS